MENAMLDELKNLLSLSVIEQMTKMIQYFDANDGVLEDSDAYKAYTQIVENILDDTSKYV